MIPREAILVMAMCAAAHACRQGKGLTDEESTPAGVTASSHRDAEAVPDVPAVDVAAPEAGIAADGDDRDIVALVLEGPVGKLGAACPGCKPAEKLAKSGPWLAVQAVEDEWNSPAPGKQMNTSLHLAVKTQEGWFLMRHLASDGMLCGGDHLFPVGYGSVSLEYRDIIPGDPPEVVLAYDESASGIRDEKVLVCGIGPSGRPSCVGPFTPKRDHPDGATQSWEGELVFLPDGSYEIRSAGKVSGPYTITFP